jgi:hypothetical protein
MVKALLEQAREHIAQSSKQVEPRKEADDDALD